MTRGMFANIVDVNKINVPTFGEHGKATVMEGDRPIEILSAVDHAVKTNLDGAPVPMLTLTLGEELKIDGVYTVSVEGIGTGVAIPCGIFDTEYF